MSVVSPTFTVTLVVTDSVDHPAAWAADLAFRADFTRYLAVAMPLLADYGGERFRLPLPLVGVAFGNTVDAVAAAVALQRVVAAEALPIRIAIHTGVITTYEGEYVGRAVVQVQQLVAAAHGGQIVLSHLTQQLVQEHLPTPLTLHDLGVYTFAEPSQPNHVFQLVAPDLPHEFPPLQTPARRPHNLPTPATPLVGREREVTAVMALLQQAEVRLLTLTGAGGIGKSRLGLAVATRLQSTFADGVFLVDLSTLRDAEDVIPTIATTLGIGEANDQPLLSRLIAYLAPKKMLLLLDSFEHLLAAESAVATLLAGAQHLKIMVTSRARLNVAGEHEVSVPPLPIPDAAHSLTAEAVMEGAVGLFIQRAQAVKSTFVVTDEILPTLIEVCRRLDGLPLAIELAAARCKVFTPADLLQRLDQRLPLLTGVSLDRPLRHRTLRDTIDWSYQLLDGDSQQLFQQLALFEGGATYEAVEQICTAALLTDALTTLLDHSLLQQVTQGENAPRFILLDTIREFALEHLEQSEMGAGLRQRHTAYYVRLAEQAEAGLRGATMRLWLERLDSEYANLRSAVLWNLTHNVAEAARLLAALRFFWEIRAHRSTGRSWLEQALDHDAPLSPPIRAKTLHAAGRLARALYDQPAAEQWLAESGDLYQRLGDRRGQNAALTDLGWSLVTLGGDPDHAKELLEAGLAHYRDTAEARGMAWALYGLGWVELRRALGDQRGSAWALVELQWVEREAGSLLTANAYFQESLMLRRRLQDAHDVAWSLASLALVAAAQRNYEAARQYTEERLTIERSLDNRHGIAAALQQLGVIAFRQGDIATAATWLLEGVTLARELGDTYVLALTLAGLGDVQQAQGEPDSATAAFTEALSYFQTLDDSQRIARLYARLATVALDKRDEPRMYRYAMQSLTLARTVDDVDTIGICLAGLADSAAMQGRLVWAAHLWGAAWAAQENSNVPRVPVEPLGRQPLIQRVRAALGAAFAPAWAAGRRLTSQAVLIIPESKVFTTAPLIALPSPVEVVGLTPREVNVLTLLAEGISNDQIARQMSVSVATIKSHLTAIYRKMGVSSRAAAMRYAIDNQLL